MDAVVVHGCIRCQLGCLAEELPLARQEIDLEPFVPGAVDGSNICGIAGEITACARGKDRNGVAGGGRVQFASHPKIEIFIRWNRRT